MDDGLFRPELAALATRQFGVALRRQAVAAGYGSAELRRLISSGRWVTIRRGAYVPAVLWETLDQEEQWWLRDVAAHLTMVTPHVLSHDSAVRGLGLPMLHPLEWLTHITRPGVLGSRTEHGVRHHLGTVAPRLVEVGSVTTTGLARTGLDMAREHGFKAGVVVLDEVKRRGTPDLELIRELALMRSWPGVTTARAAHAFADARAESPGESLLRVLVAELGIGEVDCQFPVLLGGGVVWGDLRVGCHLFEFDGRLKYVPVAEGGLAGMSPTEVVWAEKLRERDLLEVGLGLSRVFWDDLMGATAWAATSRRLRDDYARTVARFGRALPEHLARFASAHPRRTA